MREAFAHHAVVSLDRGGDAGAPGAAITVALCGHWEHEPPCPLAPHHTAAEQVGPRLHLRTLFVTDAAEEAEVRRRIDGALAGGELAGPTGEPTRWTLIEATASAVRPEERDHAERLAGS
jgi:hypothetical protein